MQEPARSMITFIRGIVTSRIGAAIALLFLVAMGLSFAMGDVSNINGGSNPSVSAGNVASVGSEQISTRQVRQLLDSQFQAAQQRTPGLTKAQFVAQGGLDRVVRQLTEMAAIRQYAQRLGISIDQASIDAEIARIPAFANPISGEFDQATFERVIGQQGMRPADIRNEARTNSMLRQLLGPYGLIGSIPTGMVTPYASLLLEQRFGRATFLPSQRFAPSAAPTDAQLNAFYRGQSARYSVPARRVIRYLVLDERAVPTPPNPTDAEIAAEYRRRASTFAASETRAISQVIAATREQATRIASAARTGTLAAAAQASGLQSAPGSFTSAADLASATSQEAATSAFAAAQGAVVGPFQVPLGFVVIKVDNIERRPARSLAEASLALRNDMLLTRKREALATLFNNTQDALNRGATLEEVAADKNLQIAATPALLANGMAPAQPAFQLNDALRAVLRPAFDLNEGDPAQIIAVVPDRIFAVFDVPTIQPAAPPPLAQLRDRVIADWRLTQGSTAARDRARQIVTAVEGGMSLADAAGRFGIAGSVQPIQGRRINAGGENGRLPPEVALLFSMARGTVKTLEMPNKAGWLVIQLERTERGDATGNTELLGAVQQQLTQAVAGEYAGILIAAAKKAFPIQIDQAAVNAIRQEIAGGAAPAAN